MLLGNKSLLTVGSAVGGDVGGDVGENVGNGDTEG